MGIFQLPDNPVVERSVILKFQSTDRMGNSLNRILNRMGKIIHGINTPGIPCIMMGHMCHTVNNRVTHIDIRGSHINPGTKHLFSVCVLSVLHFLKEL